MTFSASPLVPDQRQPVDDAWKPAAQLVLTAVTEASAQVPSATPLVPDAPVADAAAVTLPDPAGAAVTAVLGGGVDGTVLLVVGSELVEALQGTPFGDLEPAQALRPALEAVATALGGRLDSTPVAVDVEGCLDTVAAGPITVYVPLLAGETAGALVAVRLDGLPLPDVAQPSAGTAATAGSAARSWGIDMLRDVEMEVTCELGRTKMTVRQLLALAPGDVVELDRLAGSPADLLVNGTLLARGEVVVVDESFGLRITEIVTKDAS